MNAAEFVLKVREMREAQKRYFTKGRLQGDLIRSKQLEGEVDKALREGVTVVETHTLEFEGAIQLGLLENNDHTDKSDSNWTFGVAPWLDDDADQRPTDGEGEPTA